MVAPGVDHNEGIFVAQSAREWEEKGVNGGREGERGMAGEGEVFKIIKRYKNLRCIWAARGRQVVYFTKLWPQAASPLCAPPLCLHFEMSLRPML